MTTIPEQIWVWLNSNIIASFLGGLWAAVVFWKLFERKVKILLEDAERKRISKSFIEETLYNLIVANQAIEKVVEWELENRFTLLEYQTKGTEDFLNSEPLSLSRKYYINLRVYLYSIKKDNKLLNIHWFGNTPNLNSQAEHRKVFVDNAKVNQRSISTLITDTKFVKEMEKLELADKLEDYQGK